jgi:hypothetical protein
MKNATEELKSFHKAGFKNVPNNIKVAGRRVWVYKETIMKEIKPKQLYCFVFLRNKVFPGTL